jgi:primary-amine oxidase
MYYRPHVDDSQYTYPLDFCPIYNSDTQEIVHIDVPLIRRPLNKAPPNNYHAAAVEAEGGYRTDLKPINVRNILLDIASAGNLKLLRRISKLLL